MADLVLITRERGEGQARRAINLDTVLAFGRCTDGTFYVEHALWDPKREEPYTDYFDLPGDEEALEPLLRYLEMRWKIDLRKRDESGS